ncbi:hydroxyethylthiazole kinase [Corynebacterium alimapuense]|uniref:Hydroxyethylthiazole kinase n=1 Tax=Corynebacterium alimapuense TaxID=1576874 RepID=A0A3M8K9C9_9CORY|nr:hydroxyethylthiazole kinase [Corynebacterium alimapuense]RNE49124.1 hydroxyethylthiazole kinase [Corynebacterium alimapuense]
MEDSLPSTSPYLTAIDLLRETAPLVQCLTNSVVMEITANVLLAAGASPAMADTPEESAEFAAVADGVLINPGTPSAEQYAGMREAIRGAVGAGTPWVMDPVAAGGLVHRTMFLRSVLDAHPAAIRGNASEIVALAGHSTGGRGVDSTEAVIEALPAAQELAIRTGGVIAVSGPRDLIVSSGRVTWLKSGDPLMQRVIGTGCSLGALTAAYLALPGLKPHDAVLAAHAHAGAAGQVAARRAQAPGSFAVAWIDALYLLTSAEIAELTTVKESA